MTTQFDFNKICRVCMGEGIMMSLFKVNFSKKMMACANIKVWPNDGLPGQICSKCASRLHIAYQFRQQCEKSDLKLRQYHANVFAKEDKELITNIETVEENEQQIPNEPCAYTQNPQILESPAPDQKYNHFMTVGHNTQREPSINFDNINAENQAQVTAYNIIGEVIYNPQYQVQPAEVQTNILHSVQPQSETPEAQITEKIQNNHQSEDCFVCTTCGKVFTSKLKLNRHIKIHTRDPGDLPYKCEVCGKGFPHGGNFKIHMRIHSNERPFKCPVCSKGCRQAQDLEKHMRTHTGERPHKCHFCPKAFATSSNLVAHVRTHTGERPYVCCVCQKAFCQSNELTKHMRMHTGEKSHICDICNRGFNGSSALTIHKRSHTDERPFNCPFCERTFRHYNVFTSHLKKHKSKALKCVSCNLEFVSLWYYKNHMSSEHPNEDISTILKNFGMSSKNIEELQCNVCQEKFDKASEYTKHIKLHSNGQES